MTLTLNDAKQMLSTAERVAGSLGIPYCVAVVDAGGHLIAFLRQDGALIGSVDLAIDKAKTARIFDKTTLLAISGHYVDVGLVGDRIDIPLFPRVSREQTLHGSFWGNYTDLSEVMALAAEDKIRHSIKLFRFDQLNEYIELMRAGDVVGRAVMKF